MVYASSNDSKRVAKQPSKRWDPEASPLPTPGEPKAPAKEQQVMQQAARCTPVGCTTPFSRMESNMLQAAAYKFPPDRRCCCAV